MMPEFPTAIKQQIIEDMRTLYEELHKDLSQLPAPCTSCGFCCHFDAAQHSLYVTTLEMIYLFDKYQVTGEVKKHCPFLRDNLCSVHDRRMLGCRTYFRLHNKEQTIAAEQIYEKYLGQIKDLHIKYNVEWNYQDCMNIFQEMM